MILENPLKHVQINVSLAGKKIPTKQKIPQKTTKKPWGEN